MQDERARELEDRLIRLEEDQVFQERRVEELNGALLEQQRQINRLELLAGRQERKLDELAELLAEAAGPGRGGSEKPPHYQP